MTEEQKNVVVQLMRKEIDPSCYYKDGDFIIFRGCTKGFYRQMIIKETSPWVLLYGGNYKKMRDLFAERLANFATDEYIVDIPSKKVKKTNAVWCRIKFQLGGDWFYYRDKVVTVARKLMDKVNEWGILGNVSQCAIAVEPIFSEKDLRALSNVKDPSGMVMNQVVSENGEKKGIQMPQAICLESSDKKRFVTSSLNMSEYWEAFYANWDRFVCDWLNANANPNDEISEAYQKITGNKLDFRELPEPYLGTPDKGVKAVIINLNPGESVIGKYGQFQGRNLEETKFFCNLNQGNGSGWLIDAFVNEAKGSYKSYINEIHVVCNSGLVNKKETQGLSCLNPDLLGNDPEVCGVAWWQGMWRQGKCQSLGTMGWLCQVYDEQIDPRKVFALEICPYHSKKWDTIRMPSQENTLSEFIRDNIIIPAAMAVTENKLRFATAIGKSIVNLLELETLHGAGFKIEIERDWKVSDLCPFINCTKDDCQEQDCLRKIWPVKFVERNYRLYKIIYKASQADSVIQNIRILATWARGGNSAPAKDFSLVEGMIRNYCDKHPLHQYI